MLFLHHNERIGAQEQQIAMEMKIKIWPNKYVLGKVNLPIF